MEGKDDEKSSYSTPMYSHVWEDGFRSVYEPSEDTFLLLDSIEADSCTLQSLRPLVVLEVGIGSGVVLSFVRKIIGTEALYIGLDINESATLCTERTAKVNGYSLEIIRDNLTTSVQKRLTKAVDLLVFNPPYVVTESSEVGSQLIEASWAGGTDGREVTDRFLPLATDLLSETGVMYLVLIDKNKPDEVLHMMRKLGIKGEIVSSKKAGIENLRILRFQRVQKASNNQTAE